MGGAPTRATYVCVTQLRYATRSQAREPRSATCKYPTGVLTRRSACTPRRLVYLGIWHTGDALCAPFTTVCQCVAGFAIAGQRPTMRAKRPGEPRRCIHSHHPGCCRREATGRAAQPALDPYGFFSKFARQEASHTPSAISYDVPRPVPSNLMHHVQKSADALYKTRALASSSLSEFAPPSLALRPLLTLVIPPSDIFNIPVVSRYRS